MQRQASGELINIRHDGVRFIEEETMKEIFERRSYIICACMVFIVAMVGLPSAKAPGKHATLHPDIVIFFLITRGY